MSNEPVTTPRRSLRYTSPETSSSLSPRRPSDTTTIANVRPHTNGDQSYSTINHTSPTISPFLVAHVIQEPGSNNIGALPQINGQNHDRMETDIDSEDSRSDNQSHATADDSVENPRGGLQQNDGETMDTTPRSQIASGLQPALDEGRFLSSLHISSTELAK